MARADARHRDEEENTNAEDTSKLAVFEGKRIRRTLHEGEWWFSIIDVVDVLVGGDRLRKCWNDLKKKMLQEGYDQLSEKIGQVRIEVSENIGRLTTSARDRIRAYRYRRQPQGHWVSPEKRPLESASGKGQDHE